MKKGSIRRLFSIFGITGILLLQCGTPVPGLAEAFRNGTVTANVKLRKAPGLQGRVISGLLKGSAVQIYAEQNGWYRVSAKKYYQVFNGWVSKQYVAIAGEKDKAPAPVAGAPEPAEATPSRTAVGEPVQPAPVAAPEQKVPPPAVAPAPEPAPPPEMRPPAEPPKTKKADTPTARPLRVAKAPQDTVSEPADDVMYLIPMALPVLAVIVLLVVVIVYRLRRKPGPQEEKPEMPVETAPPERPPPAEDEPAPAELEPSEEDLPVDLDFEMEATFEDPPPDKDDEGPRPPGVVSVYDTVIERINRMSDLELVELLELVDKQPGTTSRHDERLIFLTTVDYVVNDQYYRDFIQDLSAGGVFIKTRQMFEPGQAILMTFMSPYLQKPFKISGEIVRTLDSGIGVKFHTESQVQAEALSALIDQIRKIEASA